MTRVTMSMLAAIFWGLMLVPASGQSLGEVARQEALRRESIKQSGKVLTNADLPATAVVQPAPDPAPAAGAEATDEGGSATPTSVDGPAAGGEAAPRAAGSTAAPAPAPSSTASAAPRDDEEGWRQRAAAVNKAVADARGQFRLLRALSDRLALEMQAGNPATAGRAAREREDVKTQMAAAETREIEATAARRALEQEARAAGVPPAWIQ